MASWARKNVQAFVLLQETLVQVRSSWLEEEELSCRSAIFSL